LASASALAALRAATRFHHFGSAMYLPDASLAVFFLGGLYLRRALAFGARLGRGRGRRQPSFNDALDHFDSTDERESCILVNVHSAELLKDAEWVAPSSLSDSVRMNRNNLLGHHS
jgi:hypothetical protein